MLSNVTIAPLQATFLKTICQVNGGPAWHQDEKKWNRYLFEHCQGQRYTLLAFFDDEPVGYGSLVFASQHRAFRGSGTPEINDLVVAENWRRKGIASRLIEAFENEAIVRGYREIGLGVGLYADYGPAQRLYSKLGYLMDGQGITAHNEIVSPGSTVRVDDDLVVWLSKKLPPINGA